MNKDVGVKKFSKYKRKTDRLLLQRTPQTRLSNTFQKLFRFSTMTLAALSPSVFSHFLLIVLLDSSLKETILTLRRHWRSRSPNGQICAFMGFPNISISHFGGWFICLS